MRARCLLTATSLSEFRAAAVLRAGPRQFSQASERALLKHGLTTERYELLLVIKAAQNCHGRATVAELSGVLGVAQSSLTQLARRVEDAGLLCREVSSADARARYLRLTELGDRQLTKAVEDLHQERENLAAVLDRL